MTNGNILNTLKRSFEKVVPKDDDRTVLSPLNLVIGLTFCFMGDSKSFSIESMRRFIMSSFKIKISKGAFWERLTTERLKNIFKTLIAELIRNMSGTVLIGVEILSQLKVTGIYLIDSSSITLWDGAKGAYPGTRTHAGIKWHACFDLLSGVMNWFDTTSTATNDSQCFPEMKNLFGKLIIFDLGYWNYGLLIMIEEAKGFFLSRIKSNSVIFVEAVVQGLSPVHIGKQLSSINFKKKRSYIIEFIGGIYYKKLWISYRVIGFWNSNEKKYHWYITNLKVPALVVYPLYKIRWQVELIFKGCKRSFNLDKKPVSNNENIIETAILSTIVACLASHVVLSIGAHELNEDEKISISFQRICQVTVLLAKEFIAFLINSSKKYFLELLSQIKLLSSEIYEKNYRRRPTTLKLLKLSLEMTS